jgi:hypothetical protein
MKEICMSAGLPTGSTPTRLTARALLLSVLFLPFAGCGSSTQVDSVTVTPTTENITICGSAANNPIQLTAIGTINHGSHPVSYIDLTNTAKWATSFASIATVTSTGLVTVTPSTNGWTGNATISATVEGFGGPVSGSALFTKTIPSNCTSEAIKVHRE